nr:hypothetical protein [Micromonospora sp. DSM 115978]
MRRRSRWFRLRDVTWHLVAALRRLAGLRPAAVLVDEIRCPWCHLWVKPRHFDLRHMACRTCMATLARPSRKRGLMW